ncbi:MULTISPECIES: hypothetical protein [Burkholderia cepacia complex]|uniref:hypothetical protein n=1 Tax=Burkholderia cepacia complex TaxID=87882 RepID=UPI000F5B592E|nr:hypothetical protein [Burkholderia cenocepacia]MBR8506526.1 hypothetical protein [Burkholderia cenocepacia]
MIGGPDVRAYRAEAAAPQHTSIAIGTAAPRCFPDRTAQPPKEKPATHDAIAGFRHAAILRGAA